MEIESPLDGVRVIDLTEALAGPYCTMLLGDLGADVIKVERPDTGDQSRAWGPPFVGDQSAYFLASNRNKRSLALDLKAPGGLEVLHRLLARADVFVNNLRQRKSLRQYGLDFEELPRLNPRLITACLTGYGHTGPSAGRAGYDLVAQGEAGLMSLTGEPGDPPMRFPVPIADMSTGLYAALGILAALFARERTGQGQILELSLVETMTSWLALPAGQYFATGQRPRQVGNAHANIVPYQVFRARDKYLIVCVGTERHWQRLCEVLGAGESLAQDPRFATNRDRNRHRAELIPVLAGLFEREDADTWLARLQAAEIPSGPIHFPDETLADPHLLERGLIVTLDHPVGPVRSLANPIRLGETPVVYRRPPPALGQHTAEILAEVGD